MAPLASIFLFNCNNIQDFGEYFMKIGTKIAKLQMHKNFHKNVNENMFSFTVLCKFS